MSNADPRFPHLMRELRENSGLSLRQLARLVHYSHAYLWDIETGRKPPTPEIAAALDSAFDAGDALTSLADARTEAESSAPDSIARGPIPPYVDHHQLEDLAQRARSASSDAETRNTAGQWARYASFLYETFVRSRPRLLRFGAARYSRRSRTESGTSPFRMEVLQQGRTPTVECRSVTRRPAPRKVSDRLLIEAGEPVVRRENWYHADAELIQIGVTYVPTDIAQTSPIARSKFLGRGSLYSRFEDLGYRIDRIREEVTTRLPAPGEAAALNIQAGVPVLEVMHTSYDKSGRPFEVTCFTMRADLAALEYELLVND
ncbi:MULTISPECIES: UTRA domain-containing protein [Catenuloplanes]|uniref:GntR family transcriptional regulator n=1 Tax=Catenuloplanes niger TaxID=587534 RepID=A0AAE4CV65_9ACTN|nr:UTRA domain-containing protein [Catenuloplanes niger]MDR7324163.1 GntR family transcriptional regulator [Catenuloplanes niger]